MKLPIILLLFLLIISCETVYFNEYVVHNSTNHEIKIRAFCKLCDEDYKQKSERITIAPYASYSVVRQAGFHAQPRGIFRRFEIDSISILFDEERILIQDCEKGPLADYSVERNLMDFESEYVSRKIGRRSGQKEYRYTYTFTEDDFNNAMPYEK